MSPFPISAWTARICLRRGCIRTCLMRTRASGRTVEPARTVALRKRAAVRFDTGSGVVEADESFKRKSAASLTG